MSAKFSDLGVRTLTGVMLGAVTLGALAQGGFWSALLFGIAAAAMVWELCEMTGGTRRWLRLALMTAAALAVFATEVSLLRFGALILMVGALTALFAGGRTRFWMSGGLLYIGLAMCCVEGLRRDPLYGFETVLWLFLVVIASDVGGYFGGRLIGGPKLWPRVSPKKTWAGTLVGMAMAAVAGAFFARWTTGTLVEEVATVSAVTAMLSQAGDIAESAVKRRFGVKDSSALIPGHGGVLDRLDGLMAAALFSATITFARGQSLFIW